MSKGMPRRNDRLLKEKRNDAYREEQKLPEPTQCTECEAVFMNGRWSWEKTSQQANQAICPACRRIADKYPAGYIEMKGNFFQEHQDEILNLTRNIEEREKHERPLERIMEIKNNLDHMLITTTGIHLARRIGEALLRSYKGELQFQYTNRVSWERI